MKSIFVAGDRAFDIELDKSREKALQRLRALRKSLPQGWRLDRDEANSR